MRLAILSAFLALPASAQTITFPVDSLRLQVGDTVRVTATVRPSGTATFSGNNAAAFGVSRDGRVVARAVGCGFVRASSGDWTRGQVPTCVVARDTVKPVPPSRVLFRSDWPVRGDSLAAVLGGVWPSGMASVRGLAVVSSAGLDFPMPNVLQVTALAARSGFAQLRHELLDTLKVGEARGYRLYFRPTFPDQGDAYDDNQSHPWQDGNASQYNAELSVRHYLGGPGRFTPAFMVSTRNGFDHAEWTPPSLPKHQTYRIEMRLERVSAEHFTLSARLYNARDSLLFDDDDFRSNNRTTTLASRPRFLFNAIVGTKGLNVGLNGLSNLTRDVLYGYQGGAAICSDWCGKWVP